MIDLNGYSPKVINRFWAKIDKSGSCWVWTGSLNEKGYGRVWNGKILLAHRVSWEIANGLIPKKENRFDTCILHKCDNPKCVNPEHLYLGTQKDNVEDRTVRDRAARQTGESNPQAKLSWPAVEKIRQDMRPHKYVAADYGLSYSQTKSIRNYWSWRYKDGVDCKPAVIKRPIDGRKVKRGKPITIKDQVTQNA